MISLLYDLFFCHLVLQPGTEALTTVCVSCAAYTPHQREKEPGLDQLLQTVQFLLWRWPLILQDNK